MQAGQREQAIERITTVLADPKYDQTVDPQGRLLVPNAQLMALQLMDGPQHPAFAATAQRLRERLEDYETSTMSATQRRFLLHELSLLLPDGTSFAMLPAEELAADFVKSHPSPRRDLGLHASQLPDLWQLASPSHRVVALLRTETVIKHSQRALSELDLPTEVVARLLPPNATQDSPDLLFAIPAGKYQPGWQLHLFYQDHESADAIANHQIAIYLWTGLLVIAGMGALAGWIAHVFRRQMRLARLKNDLVATVSHELKTPLASIRLLIDTLLDDPPVDSHKSREYLQLVAKENARLSRLIDNFLTFSRMERNKQAFCFRQVDPGQIVHEAVDAMGERLEPAMCDFRLEVAPILPMISADSDALTTAVINLLENACKYSGDDRQVTLRAFADGHRIHISVEDNGIGLSRAAAKKVFQRFFQVDCRLSRTSSGCGLGLSIVKYIVDAHGGTVEISSRPEEGSTFTITLPIENRKAQTK